MNLARLKKLQAGLKRPVLVKKKENLSYLTGHSFDLRAEEYLLIKKNGVVGFGSGLEHIGWIKKSDSLKNIAKYLKGNRQLDIEYGFTYGEGEYLKFKVESEKLKVKVQPAGSPVDRMRMIKEPGEIALVRKSMQIVERVFEQVRGAITEKGMTEIKLAEFIRKAGLGLGAEDISFPPIVASGANAAIPHHVPANKKLVPGESIILDFGFKYKGYCSDFTRTVFLKSAPKRLAEAYDQVEKAYEESIHLIDSSLTKRGAASNIGNRGEILAGEAYQKAVDVLAEKKLDKYFTHSLGHGTGLEIHELPNLSPGSKDVLSDGLVFSIEPGVYFPKLGGIRIEDLVYMEKGSVKKFINVPTELENNIFG